MIQKLSADLVWSQIVARAWCDELAAAFERFDLLACPTLTIFPPRLDEAEDLRTARCTLPVNLAGLPAVALPVPTGGPLPASLQLIGPAGSEATLLAAAAVVEAATA